MGQQVRKLPDHLRAQFLPDTDPQHDEALRAHEVQQRLRQQVRWAKKLRGGSRSKPMVFMTEHGLYISKAAWEAMGGPDHVRVGMLGGKLIVEPAQRGQEGAFRAKQRSDRKGWRGGVRVFISLARQGFTVQYGRWRAVWNPQMGWLEATPL